MLQPRLSAHLSLEHKDIKKARFKQRAFFMANVRQGAMYITDLRRTKEAGQHFSKASDGRQ